MREKGKLCQKKARNLIVLSSEEEKSWRKAAALPPSAFHDDEQENCVCRLRNNDKATPYKKSLSLITLGIAQHVLELQ